jgi:hypothetical protein
VSPTSRLVSQKEKIIKDRQKRVGHLKDVLSNVQRQVEAHETGTKKVEDDRYGSLLKRVQSYKEELSEVSGPLTDEVR